MIILVVGGALALLLAAAGAYFWWARKSIEEAQADTEASARASAGLGAPAGDVEMDAIPKLTDNPMHAAGQPPVRTQPRGTAVLDASTLYPEEDVGASIEEMDVEARFMTTNPMALGGRGGRNDGFRGEARL